MISNKLQGRFKLVVRNGRTLEKVREIGWFDNLVLDAGLNRFGTGNIASWCQVGTSNTPPAIGQTTLVSRIAGTSATSANSNYANTTVIPYFIALSTTFRFDVGVAAGNLSEVGVGWASTGSLWTRALIVNELGVPTTITVLPTEVLDVTYELRVQMDTADHAFDIQIGPTLHSCVVRPSEIDTAPSRASGDSVVSGLVPSANSGLVYTGTIGDILNSPTGTNASGTATWLAYSNNSLRRTVRYTWGLTSGNFNIQAARFKSGLGFYQVSFSPPIPKTNTKSLTLDFEFVWGRL